MRPSTSSAGKPKTPISSEARMTSCVRLSRARPRKPLTSPGAAQRSGRLRAGGGVVGGAAGEESPRLTSDASREIHAPAELATMRGHRLVVELHQRGRPRAEHETDGVGAVLACLIVLEHGLHARMLAFGVGVQEHLEPPCDLVVGAARKHAAILASASARAVSIERITTRC